ncbi:FAD/FMN-containing dehydrogenase [Balamuthia mandrillaris]
MPSPALLAGLATFLLALHLLVLPSQADIYMHNPRGSNNRLVAASNNRLFDSQNNNNGGYHWGPKMHFLTGSRLSIEWTHQHSCANPNTHCNIVIQYMCQDDGIADRLGWDTWHIRDGVSNDIIPDDVNTYNQLQADPQEFQARGDEPARECVTGSGDGCQVYTYGMHEPYEYYQACKVRPRNQGLFVADQNPGNQATRTRQNPGGTRRGFECPEERDYYPYWYPSPWKDIAVLVDDSDDCDYFTTNSQNKRAKGYCSLPQFATEKTCLDGGGRWDWFTWGIGEPDCFVMRRDDRDNHLGNSGGGPYTSMYNWTIPDDVNERCVLRIRYNISTGDYSRNLDYRHNGAELSPVTNNPSVPLFNDDLYKVRLAVNTAQFGRTFQDRSHVFAIRDRGVDDIKRIFNINVRGKRGNIVQVYPAVEYDFTPNNLDVRVGDYIHFQWTGADSNPTGNDGEGTLGTDRSNVVFVNHLSKNYPAGDQDFFSGSSTARRFAYLDQDPEQCAADYQAMLDEGLNQDQRERDPRNCELLNAASRYFDGGLLEITEDHAWTTYHYISTRNNNFSNRSQKGTITVVPFLPVWAIVLVSLGGLFCLVSLALSGVMMWARFHPQSGLAHTFSKLS